MSRLGTRRTLRSRPPSAGGNWWDVAGVTCMAAYQPKGAASYAASLVNLANPGTYDAIEGVAPTFDTATGWSFNGSDDYLIADGLVPSNNTWTFIVRVADIGATFWQTPFGTCMAGAESIETGMRVLGGGGTQYHYYYLQHYDALQVAGKVTNGVMALAGDAAYLDGVSEGTVNTTTNAPTFNLGIGVKNAATPSGFLNGKIVALAVYSSTLTSGQVATVSAAMAAL